MSASFRLPLVLNGSSMTALVVGGGSVASRKVRVLLDGGASVRVRAPSIVADLEALAGNHERLLIELSGYDDAAIAGAMLVVAATDDRALNARVAADACRAGRLTIVVDDPSLGNCIMPAVHRSGDLVVAVSSGGVPGASARIRDALARRLDERYATALHELGRLRRRLLDERNRERWQEAARALIADDFCDSVESGAFSERVAQWR